MYSNFILIYICKSFKSEYTMFKFIFIVTVLYFLILGCTKIIYLDSKHIKDNKYDSEFPNVPTTEYLEIISNSVKLVNVMASYRMYELSFESGIKKGNLDEDEIKKIPIKEGYISSPASGTATIIYNDFQKISLISCAHIFNFPDTIIVNHLDDLGNITSFVQSVYFKVQQNITIPGLPEIGGYEILASDTEKDIVVIGKKYKSPKMTRSRPFQFPKGKAQELEPGTFVYLFGFPRGEQMVSKAIVGKINRDKEYGFIIDAAVHNGVSGGPVLAIRDGIPNFELVGMVFAIAGEMLQLLGPEEDQFYDANNQKKYTGDVYLKSTRQIVYGITYVISIETIEDFFNKNKSSFLNQGYNSGLFLSKQNSVLKN